MTRKMLQLIQASALSVSAAVFGGLVGCTAEVDTHPDHVDRVERVETTRVERTPPVVVERQAPPVIVERDRYPDRYPPVPAQERPEVLDRRGVPRDAVMLQEGPGSIGIRARNNGTVYLFDIEDQRVVWSGQIRDGDRFSLDADADTAALNGRSVYHDESVRRHRHRIFIDTN